MGKQKQGNHQINNIKMANMVIFKWLKKEKVKNKEVDHIAAITKSQKLELIRIFGAEKFRPISLVIKLLNKIVTLISSLFLSILENNDIKDSMIVTGCRYERSDRSLSN